MKLSRAIDKIAAWVVVEEDGTGRESTVTMFEPEINVLLDGIPGNELTFRFLSDPSAECKVDRRNVVAYVAPKSSAHSSPPPASLSSFSNPLSPFYLSDVEPLLNKLKSICLSFRYLSLCFVSSLPRVHTLLFLFQFHQRLLCIQDQSVTVWPC